MGFDVKKRDYYYFKMCKHAKKPLLLTIMRFWSAINTWGGKRENKESCSICVCPSFVVAWSSNARI
jgi:hypothetical protein